MFVFLTHCPACACWTPRQTWEEERPPFRTGCPPCGAWSSIRDAENRLEVTERDKPVPPGVTPDGQ